MLLWILGCLAAGERPVTGFHDDAGFIVAQIQARRCVEGEPCAIWDARLFVDGPQVVGLGRPCSGECASPSRNVPVLGRSFDGVTGVLAGDNPLLVALNSLGCHSREACHVILDGYALLVTHGGSRRSARVDLQED